MARRDVPLFQSGINPVQFVRVPASSLGRPPNDALQNHRHRDDENRDDRIHDRTALKESLKYRVAFGPVRNERPPDAATSAARIGAKLANKVTI